MDFNLVLAIIGIKLRKWRKTKSILQHRKVGKQNIFKLFKLFNRTKCNIKNICRNHIYCYNTVLVNIDVVYFFNVMFETIMINKVCVETEKPPAVSTFVLY